MAGHSVNGPHQLRNLTLLACAVLALAGTATADAAACSDLEVVFARGSGEAPGLGITGTPLVSDVKSALPSASVSSYAVDYAASYDQTSAGPGAPT
ncbi:hypothetical protein GCM10017786_66320 [Amycolatopsis deserti]|uniref:Cutinase family protein n=1 Tax=Amycolatopsis deserti TaxID=185696 RepID=A0ABQ3JGS4_9PSEU|nr:hypothetical protein GCM10017786_66320 [Amycolatopsis deserti]